MKIICSTGIFNEEKGFPLPNLLNSPLMKQEIMTVKYLRFQYIPIMTSNPSSSLTIDIKDTRLVNWDNRSIFQVKIFGDVQSSFIVSGLQPYSARDRCPYLLSLSVNAGKVVPGTKYGILKSYAVYTSKDSGIISSQISVKLERSPRDYFLKRSKEHDKKDLDSDVSFKMCRHVKFAT
ncbi:P3 protein [Rice stripe mosaic virus]|uniref:P3 protein n=1 Tax=Rice stripe mosaic virus TaxID=1931356 RepID=A0A1P8D6T0_9RHAB|nr:P3 protein [Rice stripe mosaic virus]APR74651.1 P3 protein [Rice stripe mosaic virus]AZB50413.1 P3 protein [Rice stripe mosaic virus]AZB50420.1 P3 protein [Rice stripe mosaic virus]AZB50427.1 P3 protein [Rice stripe mosaic virus]AZB50434.1 P3 protein [Rice stripe mosaic virus]